MIICSYIHKLFQFQILLTALIIPSLILAGSGGLVIQIRDDGGPDAKLAKLAGLTIIAIPNFDEGKIGKWRLTGSLADQLGLSN